MTSLLQEIVALLAITNPLGAVPVSSQSPKAFPQASDRDRPSRGPNGHRDSLCGCACRQARLGGIWNHNASPSSDGRTRRSLDGTGDASWDSEQGSTRPGAAKQSMQEQVVVPLAMLLLAGPGAITTVLTLSSRVATWREMKMLLIAVGVVGALIVVALTSAWSSDWLPWPADSATLHGTDPRCCRRGSIAGGDSYVRAPTVGDSSPPFKRLSTCQD